MALREAEDWEFEDLNKAEAWITNLGVECGILFGDLRLAMDNAEEAILQQNDPAGFARWGRCPESDLVQQRVAELIDSLLSQNSQVPIFLCFTMHMMSIVNCVLDDRNFRNSQPNTDLFSGNGKL